MVWCGVVWRGIGDDISNATAHGQLHGIASNCMITSISSTERLKIQHGMWFLSDWTGRHWRNESLDIGHNIIIEEVIRVLDDLCKLGATAIFSWCNN